MAPGPRQGRVSSCPSQGKAQWDQESAAAQGQWDASGKPPVAALIFSTWQSFPSLQPQLASWHIAGGLTALRLSFPTAKVPLEHDGP